MAPAAWYGVSSGLCVILSSLLLSDIEVPSKLAQLALGWHVGVCEGALPFLPIEISRINVQSFFVS